MPCGESSLTKGIVNQAGPYISFKSFSVDTYHFLLLYPGLVSKQASSLPVQPAGPFRATASPDLGSSGRPRDWGWAAEAGKPCVRCPRFIPKDSFSAKHPGDACSRATGCSGEVCLGHGPVTVPPSPWMSTYLPPAVPLEKPRLPERQAYLSSGNQEGAVGRCSLLFCSQNLQSMLCWEVLLGGGPCRVQACRQPQRGPSSGRTLLLPQWFSCIQPWRPSLSGLVPAHTHTRTHTQS